MTLVACFAGVLQLGLCGLTNNRFSGPLPASWGVMSQASMLPASVGWLHRTGDAVPAPHGIKGELLHDEAMIWVDAVIKALMLCH